MSKNTLQTCFNKGYFENQLGHFDFRYIVGEPGWAIVEFCGKIGLRHACPIYIYPTMVYGLGGKMCNCKPASDKLLCAFKLMVP